MTSQGTPEEFRVGTDIGGTFTDIVFAGSKGTILTKKILSTPDDYSRAIAEGIKEVLVSEGLQAASIKEVVHGTTIVTNTCIELTGAKVGLITTKGFRDVLEIARGRMPELYNLAWKKPVPLVPRYLRFEVDERIGKSGEIIRGLNTDEVTAVIERLLVEGVESVAICLYNSPRNPVHEEAIETFLRKKVPQFYLSRSTKIRSMLKEYERTSETVVNAYVMPAVTRYLRSLRHSLNKIGVQAPIYVMQSSGGMITAEEAAEMPVEIVECGPAAGVVGAAHLAEQQHIRNIITLDLGGTTTKACVVEEGEYTRSPEYEVGAGIHRASRLHKGKGYVLRIPSIDIAEIGAGGGSIVWMDKGGLMNVGPGSSGASPGPVCYDKGGMEPTLTDSYVILGYMNPDYLLGGDFVLNSKRAHEVYRAKIAKPLDRGLLEAAYGVYVIANSNINRAITSVSSERGRDPRKFSLFVFGGAGALHGAAVARALGIKKVIVPPLGGIFSAYGLLCADIERNYVETFDRVLETSALENINHVMTRMVEQALASARDHGYAPSFVQINKYADLRYKRQASELTILLPREALRERDIRLLHERFDEEYQKTFGYHFTHMLLEVIHLRVSSTCCISKPTIHGFGAIKGPPVRKGSKVRKAYFGPGHGLLDTPVLTLEEIGSIARQGPILIDTYDTTIVVPPDCRIGTSSEGSLNIDIQ